MKKSLEFTATPSTPKYVQLAAQLKQQICNGELGVNDRLPSFLEMRTQYGATPTTVEKVYASLEREGLIRREARRGVFVASAGDRENGEVRDTRTQTGLVGFVGSLKEGSDLYSDQLMKGIRHVLSEAEKQIVLLDGQSTAGLEKVDGVLVCSTCLSEPILRQLPAELPCTSLLLDMKDRASMIADDYQGAKLAIEHLIGLGHRKIACLMEFALPLPRRRLSGYHDALTEAGIALNPSWMRQHWQPRAGYTHWGREAMNEWLRDGWQELGCTAIFVQNDSAALGVMDALLATGIRVPEDVSVIGFDGTDMCEYSQPHLSSVAIPLYEIGVLGTKSLLRQIETGQRDTKVTKLPTQLREGQSVGTPPSDGING